VFDGNADRLIVRNAARGKRRRKGALRKGGGNQAGGSFGNRDDGFGPGGRGGWYDPRRGGIWDPRNRGLWQGNPEALRQAQEQLTDASRELLTNANRLRDQGLSEEELKAVRELGEALRGGLQGNPELLDQEFQRLVNLTEQLELKLASTGGNGERAAVRAQAPSQIAEGYEDAVAEYFRQLSRSGQPGSQPGPQPATQPPQ